MIQKYETFKMEDDGTVENMITRFKTFVARLDILKRGYSAEDHL